MDRAQEYKAAVNDAIRTYRLAGRKFNYTDLLAEVELQQIAEAKHTGNGNGNGNEPPKVKCWCDEGIVNGKRVAIHRPADCAYVRRGVRWFMRQRESRLNGLVKRLPAIRWATNGRRNL